MKATIVTVLAITVLLAPGPTHAAQAAVIPAYAPVSLAQSFIRDYQTFLEEQNRAAARRLLHADKVFQSPRDIRVEVVQMDKKIAKVKMNRLDKNAKPVTLYFWTLADQLIMLPPN